MAIQTGEFVTSSAIGMREDLINKISIVAQQSTPFLEAIPKGAATAIKHEWQTDSLATPADNAYLEGDTLSLNSITATARLFNYTQINYRVFAVSVTEQLVQKAGRQDEMAYQQVFKFGREIYRDIERTYVGTNRAYVAGNSTTIRKAAPVLAYIKTNVNKASDGSNPAGTGADARTDGTARAFTQSLFLDVMQQCYQSGATPNLLLASPFNMIKIQGFDNFTTKTMPMADTKTLGGSFEMINTPFGTVAMKPDFCMRSAATSDSVSELLILDTNFWQHCLVHDLMVKDVARVADSETPRQLRIEFTLQASNEKSSGIVADLAVS
jgi:hypothetical protein